MRGLADHQLTKTASQIFLFWNFYSTRNNQSCFRCLYIVSDNKVADLFLVVKFQVLTTVTINYDAEFMQFVSLIFSNRKTETYFKIRDKTDYRNYLDLSLLLTAYGTLISALLCTLTASVSTY
jgi:hypothetical protein